MPSKPSKRLETFVNPNPGREYTIRFTCPEFTCLCPRTGQPDFAVFRIAYVPARTCVELKSLKLYLWSFRNEGHFHEEVTNRILDDLVAALRPRRMTVEGDFNVRGGIHTVVTAEHDSAAARRIRPSAAPLSPAAATAAEGAGGPRARRGGANARKPLRMYRRKAR